MQDCTKCEKFKTCNLVDSSKVNHIEMLGPNDKLPYEMVKPFEQIPVEAAEPNNNLIDSGVGENEKKILDSLCLKFMQLDFEKIWTKEGTLKRCVITFKQFIINTILGVLGE